MDRVAYVNEMYGDCKQGQGSMTEMGNIYIRFGKPNTVVKRHHETEYYPYEIWHYHKAGRFNNKRFCFFAPCGVRVFRASSQRHAGRAPK